MDDQEFNVGQALAALLIKGTANTTGLESLDSQMREAAQILVDAGETTKEQRKGLADRARYMAESVERIYEECKRSFERSISLEKLLPLKFERLKAVKEYDLAIIELAEKSNEPAFVKGGEIVGGEISRLRKFEELIEVVRAKGVALPVLQEARDGPGDSERTTQRHSIYRVHPLPGQ